MSLSSIDNQRLVLELLLLNLKEELTTERIHLLLALRVLSKHYKDYSDTRLKKIAEYHMGLCQTQETTLDITPIFTAPHFQGQPTTVVITKRLITNRPNLIGRYMVNLLFMISYYMGSQLH